MNEQKNKKKSMKAQKEIRKNFGLDVKKNYGFLRNISGGQALSVIKSLTAIGWLDDGK